MHFVVDFLLWIVILYDRFESERKGITIKKRGRMIDRIGRESSLDYLPIDGATLTKMQRLDYFYIWRAEKKESSQHLII